MKILVADDDPIARSLTAGMLTRNGYEVIAVENGRQAMQQLSEADGPRLALIDWMMPEQDGPSVCRELRERQGDSYKYILLLTSKQSNDDVVLGLEAGADDYLTKPCDSAELRARLRTGRRILELEDRLVEAREHMRYKATHDSLTLLWNRGAILTLLRSELSRSERDPSAVSLLLCDIDHFKQINDVYGHIAGDDVLSEVATRLSSSVRPHDAVGRYGGEEFLVVLGGCDSEHLKERAEQVRTSISRAPFLPKQGPVSLSISIGAITIDQEGPHDLIEPLLKKADAALYRAKCDGRNRVVYG